MSDFLFLYVNTEIENFNIGEECFGGLGAGVQA